MEDVLEVYARPRDPDRPLVCLDEFCKQLIGEAHEGVAAQPGQPERQDYGYIRHGICSVFMAYSVTVSANGACPFNHWEPGFPFLWGQGGGEGGPLVGRGRR